MYSESILSEKDVLCWSSVKRSSNCDRLRLMSYSWKLKNPCFFLIPDPLYAKIQRSFSNDVCFITISLFSTGNAILGLNEYLIKKSTNKHIDVSRLFIIR